MLAGVGASGSEGKSFPRIRFMDSLLANDHCKLCVEDVVELLVEHDFVGTVFFVYQIHFYIFYIKHTPLISKILKKIARGQRRVRRLQE